MSPITAREAVVVTGSFFTGSLSPAADEEASDDASDEAAVYDEAALALVLASSAAPVDVVFAAQAENSMAAITAKSSRLKRPVFRLLSFIKIISLRINYNYRRKILYIKPAYGFCPKILIGYYFALFYVA